MDHNLKSTKLLESVLIELCVVIRLNIVRSKLRQGSYMSGKFKFFQSQGIIREFCDVSGKNEILQKCQGNVREFYISA